MSVEIYPVVHVTDTIQGSDQSAMALELGADGVYLISHSMADDSAQTLLDTYDQVRAENPERFVGINFLGGEPAPLTFLILSSLNRAGHKLPSGLWVDNARPFANFVPVVREELPVLQQVKYLGGVAFKYTRSHTEDPDEAAAEARLLSSYVDVVTTTGPGTGKAANVAKVAAMKHVIGNQRLAVASGISVENIDLYKPYVDEVLVSTSIETEPYSGIFVEQLLRNLIERAHL